MKEEARRKKLGITRKVYDPEAQPWLMRVGGKGGRKYKVNNHTSRLKLLYSLFWTFRAFVREGFLITQPSTFSRMAKMGLSKRSP